MLDPENPLVRQAVFGKQVEAFLDTPVGNYLMQRIKAEQEDGIEKLKKADPTDWKAVQGLQNQIIRVESILEWLAEALKSGEAAMQVLKQEN